MLFGNRGPRSLAARRHGRLQPKLQVLEDRQLMSIDLGGVLPPNQPNIATAPFGVSMPGLEQSGAAGFSVANVGDTNGDGFDDFVIGAPTGTNIGGQIQPGTGNNSRTYLVFGSLSVNAGNIDWLTLDNQGQRVGDLGQLGVTSQTNPISGANGFAYDGVTFLTSLNNASQLGASVAAVGDVNNDGFADFMIGAPGANDVNGLNPNTGRAYLVYGGTALSSLTTTTIDLDSTGTFGGVNILTMFGTIANGRAGRSVAGAGAFFANGTTLPDVAIGAPNASIAGLTDNGAVYVLPNSAVAAGGTGTLFLNNTVSNGLGGVIFAGSTANAEIGLSLAPAGNVDGDITSSNVGIDDFLIGASNANGLSGEAYLIYGGNALPGAGQNVGGTNVILTSRIGSTAAGGIVGATFQGTSGARSGFAVAGIGDYNSDGFDDIAIGSPFASTNTGQVDVFYGQPASGSSLVGTISLFSKPAGVPFLSLIGATQGALAGYSISSSGKINTAETGNDFIVGSPGLNGNQGGAYYIPANPFFVRGTQQLNSAEGVPLSATLVQITNTPNGAPAFLGASVSGRLTRPGQARTADNDILADFIIGASNYNVTSTGRTAAGGAFILEGSFFPIQTPQSNAINTQIGVDSGPAGPGPFVVNASSPASVDIFINSNTSVSPAFNPVTSIDLTTIVVNGVPYPSATIRPDPNGDRNNDGITDAIITISPRSRLNLTSATTTFTVSGTTTAVSGSLPFFASTAITVSGGSTPVTPGTAVSAVQVGAIIPTTFTPQFGADNYVPPTSALSRLNYKAIPRAVAYQQYMPGKGWALRLYNFAHPKALSRVSTGTVNSLAGRLPMTLDSKVFSRGKFHKNEAIEFTHRNAVIPTNRQTERALAKGRRRTI